MKYGPTPFPREVAKKLARYLDVKEGRLCQLSTVGVASQPESRTVGIRFDKKLDLLFCISHTGAPKWIHLTKVPKVAGCIYDSKAHVQLRWRASVTIISASSRSSTKQAIRRRAWELYPKLYQKFYWDAWQENHKRKPPDRTTVCPNFGVIILKPSFWYVDAVSNFSWILRRRLFKRTGTTWKKVYEGFALGKDTYRKLRTSKFYF